MQIRSPYYAAGAATSMQLGNGKWESTVTVQGGYNKLKLNYTYDMTGNADNNGKRERWVHACFIAVFSVVACLYASITVSTVF
jgi:hypothetical protein